MDVELRDVLLYAVFAVALLFRREIAIAAVTILLVGLVILEKLLALPPPAEFWFNPLLLEFCAGMLLALAYRHGLRLNRWLAVTFIAVALAEFAGSAELDQSANWRIVTWGLPSVLLFAGVVLHDNSGHPYGLARLFASVGDASYSLYLTHLLVIAALRRVLPSLLAFPGGAIAAGIILVAASLGVAIATYMAFERPLTRALNRRIGRRPISEPVAVPSR